MKLIPLLAEADAARKRCCFMMDKDGFPIDCMTNECIAWIRVQREISKKDVAGAKASLVEFGARYGVYPYKIGIEDQARWVIPDLGYCKRLWPNAKHLTGPEYASIATAGTWEEHE